jgi:hypothetical protein
VPQLWLPKPSGRIAFPPPAAGLVAMVHLEPLVPLDRLVLLVCWEPSGSLEPLEPLDRLVSLVCLEPTWITQKMKKGLLGDIF